MSKCIHFGDKPHTVSWPVTTKPSQDYLPGFAPAQVCEKCKATLDSGGVISILRKRRVVLADKSGVFRPRGKFLKPLRGNQP